MIPSLPSRGKQLIESPFVWLKEKAQLDRTRTGVPSNMWYIQGKIYDLSHFSKQHPGGDYFIELTKGQDITEMFYSHHLDLEKCQNILQKYYVRDADKIMQYFNFSENGFYRTLHKKVYEHFKNKDKGPTLSMNISILISFIGFIFTFLMTCIYQSYIYSLLCGYILYVCFGFGHNLLHKGIKEPKRYITDLLLFSHYHWSITHCISHHHYPNSNIDFEITSFEPYLISTKSKLPNNKFLSYYINLFFASVGLLEFISKIIQIIKQEEKIRKEYFIPFIEFFIIFQFSENVFQCITLFLTMQCTASFLLLKYSVLVHRNEMTYTDGTNIKPSDDFGIYIIQTAIDHDIWIPFPFNMFIFQGFNDHCLHHMFPTVDESRIPELHKYLEETLIQFNYQDLYKSYSCIDLYKSYNRLISQ